MHVYYITEAKKCTFLGPLPIEFDFVVGSCRWSSAIVADSRQTIGDLFHIMHRRKWSLNLLLLTLALRDKINGTGNKDFGVGEEHARVAI